MMEQTLGSPSKTFKKHVRYSQSMSAIGDTRPFYYSPNSSFTPTTNNFDEMSTSSQSSLMTPLDAMNRMPRKRHSASDLPLTNDCMDISAKRWAKRRPLAFASMVLFIIWGLCICTVLVQMHTASRMGLWSASSEEHRSIQQGYLASNPLLRATMAHTIPLPLPKEKVTVVLMNFGRPRMIRDSSMMRTLLSHPNVDEVLLLHANPKTAFEFVHPKVVNIDATEQNGEMGLSLRFYFAQLAKNKWIMHVDDDMEFTTEALNELFIEFSRNPQRLVGRFGRDLTLENSFNGYNSQDTHKSAEVILTKLMMMERDMCSNFFEYAHLLWSDVVLNVVEGPLWNGEDIFMALVANHVYGNPTDGREWNNYAMDWLDTWQADDSLKDNTSEKFDISRGMQGFSFWQWSWWQSILRRNRHFQYRGKLWQIAKRRLAELGDIN
jgi:hypothetical protein